MWGNHKGRGSRTAVTAGLQGWEQRPVTVTQESGRLPRCFRQEGICLQRGRFSFDSWFGMIPWRRAWLPSPVFLPGECTDRGAWRAIQSMGSQNTGHEWTTTTLFTAGVRRAQKASCVSAVISAKERRVAQAGRIEGSPGIKYSSLPLPLVSCLCYLWGWPHRNSKSMKACWWASSRLVSSFTE